MTFRIKPDRPDIAVTHYWSETDAWEILGLIFGLVGVMIGI